MKTTFIRTGLMAAASAALVFAVNGAARATNFDFEDQAATATSSSAPGALTSLTSTKDGITMTLARSSGIGFDIFDINSYPGYAPASWGERSLSPFFNANAADNFIANFSTSVSDVSIDVADFGADSDTFTMTAYDGLNGTGTLLGTAFDNYGTTSLPLFDTSSITASGVRSVVFSGGSSDFPNSLYYDNIRVSGGAVPEPGSLALFGSGILPLMGILRKRRSL